MNSKFSVYQKFCKYEITSNSARCFLFLLLVPLLTLSVFILIYDVGSLSVIAYTLPLSQTVQNWRNDVILDISTRLQDSSCYPHRELFSYEIPRTRSICDCGSNGTFRMNKMSQCNSPCRLINLYEGQIFQNWGDEDKSYRLCAQAAKGVNFINNHPINGQCENGGQLCGTGQDYGICVPDGKCPYQVLQRALYSASQIKNATQDKEKNYTYQQIQEIKGKMQQEDEIYQYITTTGMMGARDLPYQNPISDIKIKEDEICFDDINQIEIFGLTDQKAQTTCSGRIQNTFVLADTMPLKLFYNFNSKSNFFFDKQKSDEKPISIWSRPYVLWKNKCRQNNELKQFVQKADEIAILVRMNLSTLIMSSFIVVTAGVNIISLIIYSIIQCGEICLSIQKCWYTKSTRFCLSDYFRLIDPFVVGFQLFKFLLTFSYIFVTQNVIKKINEFEDFYRQYNGRECSNDQFNNYLNDLVREFENLAQTKYQNVILATIALVGEFFFSVIILQGLVNIRRKYFEQLQMDRLDTLIHLDFSDQYADQALEETEKQLQNSQLINEIRHLKNNINQNPPPPFPEIFELIINPEPIPVPAPVPQPPVHNPIPLNNNRVSVYIIRNGPDNDNESENNSNKDTEFLSNN